MKKVLSPASFSAPLLRKSKNKEYRTRQCARRLCFACASGKAARIGSRSRLPPRSVLLCFAQRCPPDTRTLLPQPTMRTEKDIGSENPETTAFSGFFRTIFQSESQKISFPQNDLWGGLELKLSKNLYFYIHCAFIEKML